MRPALTRYYYYGRGGGSEANPSELFGEDLKLWINTDTSDNKTLSGAQGSLPAITVDSLVSDDSNAYQFTPNGDVGVFGPTFNGFALGVRDKMEMYHNSLSEFKNLHDGSAFTLIFKVFIVGAADTERFPLITTAKNSQVDVGFLCMYDNRSSASAFNDLVVSIVNGAPGLAVTVRCEDVITQGEWHSVEISYTGTTMTVFVDGVQSGQATNSLTPSTADHSENLTFFHTPESTTEYARDVFFKHPICVTRVLTSTERTSINAFLDSADDTFGSGDAANVYGMYGQSNMAGGTNDYSGSPAYLDDATGALMWNDTNSTSMLYYKNEFEPHQLGVMANTGAHGIPGPDIEFAYRMNLLAPDTIFIFKYAVSETSIQEGTGRDWNTNSVGDCANHAFARQLRYGLRLLKYHYNRNVTIRGFLWRQGESDTIAPNDYYEQAFIDLVTDWFIGSTNLENIPVSKCRLVVSSLDCYVATRGQGAQNIVDQCQNVCNNAATHFSFAGGHQFSTIGFGIQADGTHFNTTGQISQGFAFYDYLKDFINE